ncbi:hypothetical protein BAE44_0016634 [Dichanthelium oligosanthes]|uniref:DUF4408 domain-containing protein n=1 Tax=Dichanthelium oligosanthes TaxID=888268 RepID=A0A1E5VB20_9POAL|nr:hypothetical protein BAE44_0016634 [Dichanthelium oligosanthes]
MSYANASRHRGGGGMSMTTVLAAKVACASAALAAAGSLARLAVPQLVSVAGAVLPRAWAVARFWLVPPYLFVTVHLIILVIWKLSDHKHFQQAQAAHLKDPWPVAQHTPHPPPASVPAAEVAAPVVKAKVEFDSSAGYGGEPLQHEFSPDSGGGESCVTTESDEDASSSPSYVTDLRRSRAPVKEHAILQREPSLTSQTMDGDGDDDLDATWNAIMQKTRPAAAAAPASTPVSPPPAQRSPQRPPPRARDPSVGAEEMNRRFDDFIKKNRNSFGRQ